MPQKNTKLQIITPNGLFWDDLVEIVTVRTTVGNIGLQHGHSPFVGALAISELLIGSKHSDYKECAIAGGIVYATPNEVRIITDAIEFKDKIDLNRAELAKKLAEAKLKEKIDAAEQHKFEVSLLKAINRISVKKGA